MRLSLLFSLPLPMLAMVVPALAAPLDSLGNRSNFPSIWKRTKESDEQEYQRELQIVKESQIVYENAQVDSATKAGMLENLKTQSLKAWAVSEKCKQLYDSSWSDEEIQAAFLQEETSRVLGLLEEKMESNSRMAVASGHRNSYLIDDSLRRLLIWEIIANEGIIGTSSLIHRRLIGEIQERALVRLKRVASMPGALSQEGVFFVAIWTDYFHQLDYREDLALPGLVYREKLALPGPFESNFDGNEITQVISGNTRDAEADRLINLVKWLLARPNEYGIQGSRDILNDVWRGMLDCVSFAHGPARVMIYHDNQSAVDLGFQLYIIFMNYGVRILNPNMDPLGIESIIKENFMLRRKDIPEHLDTPLLQHELASLFTWNQLMGSGYIKQPRYKESATLKELLESVWKAPSIRKLLREWNDNRNDDYTEIMNQVNLLETRARALSPQ